MTYPAIQKLAYPTIRTMLESGNQIKNQAKREGASVAQDTASFKVIKITTPAAADYYFRGTRWTRGEHLSEYLQQAPIYVIFDKTNKANRWVRWNGGSHQLFMDINDAPVSAEDKARIEAEVTL